MFHTILCPAVHAVAVDADVVFLSVEEDTYLCLPDGASQLTFGPDGSVTVFDDQLAAALVGRGLVSEGEGSVARHSPPPLPLRSALRDTYPPPAITDLAPTSRALADVLRYYVGKSFASLLEAAQRTGEWRQPFTLDLQEAADRYHRWAPYAPLPGKCLLRSFVLRRELRRAGLDAAWVFGVRTWPFHAHCWLQADDVVLDDHHERVRSYTPLMVI